MLHVLILISLLLPLAVFAQEVCDETTLQNCVGGCAPVDDVCEGFVQTNQDIIGNATDTCCGIRSKKRRKGCFQRFVSLTRNRKFKQLIGSQVARTLRSELSALRKNACIVDSGSGSLRGSAEPLSDLFARPDGDCSTLTGTDTYPYEARSISVPRDGSYEIIAKTSGGCFGVFSIYNPSFDADNATLNCTGTGTGEGSGLTGRSTLILEGTLKKDDTNILVASTSASVNNCSYSYTVRIKSE